MTTPFNPHYGLIVVRAALSGPRGIITLRLALDTGATRTTVNHAPLVSLGYDPATTPDRVQVTMGGSVEFSPVLAVDRIEALGLTQEGLRILAHTLPASASVDGVLGLDFLRNRRLVIDFTKGEIEISKPRYRPNARPPNGIGQG